MTQYETNYAAILIRYDCRANYRATGELEAFKKYNKAEQAIWDAEVKQIQRDEAQSA